MDDWQENSRHDMIIGRDLFSELQIDIFFSYYTIMVNGGKYEGCTASTRYMNNSCVRIPFNQLDDTIFRGE